MTVDIPGVGDDIEFPDTMTPAEVAAAAGKLHQQASTPARPGLPSTEALARRVTAPAQPQSSAFTTPEIPQPQSADRFASPGDLASYGDLAGPSAMTRRWSTAIPYAAGAAGGYVGGVPGATLGGMGGEALREAAIPGEAPHSFREGVRNIAGAGAAQGGLEALAAVPGVAAGRLAKLSMGQRENFIAKSVTGLSDAFETRLGAAKAAVPGRVAAAKASAAETSVAAGTAVKARSAAATRTAAAIEKASGTPGTEITVGDLAHHIANANGMTRTPELVQDVRARLSKVLPDYTLGKMKGNNLVFDLESGQAAKQAFSQANRAGHETVAGGTQPRPMLDRAIESAFKDLIEKRAPGVRGLNQATSKAIGEAKALTRAARRAPTEDVARLKYKGQVAQMEAKRPSALTLRRQVENKLNNRVEEPLIGLDVGLHGVRPVIRPPRDLAGKAASALGSRWTRGAAATIPRAAAFALGMMGGSPQGDTEPGLWDMQDLDAQPPPDSIMVSGHWRKLPGRR